MNLRTLASLAIALFLGLIAVILVRNVLTTQGAKTLAAGGGGGPDGVPVVVAALPIERGVGLKPAMLKIVNYPKDAVPAGAFQTVESLTAAPGRTTLRSITANEPVLTAKLSGAGGKLNLSGSLTPGMRAISVRSSDVAGVGGFVLPGDRVDILITRTTGEGAAATTLTQVMAENALVLGVDQTSDQETDKPQVAKAVTVEVTPDQAQAISLAQSIGQVTLSLRQISDSAPLARHAITVAELGGFGGRPALAGAPVAVRRVVHARRAVQSAPSGMTDVRVTRGVETSGYSVRSY
ncbi:MAG TPA: Flp pilus assembly protein CpaB [Phenylobacterium sp.]|nr:Flp pilus assembly protein CpaB [Phenylobacterium sp.]